MWKNIKKKFFNNKEKSPIDYLIVGLGNPGEKYAKTAHNVGFRIASIIREENNLPSFTKDSNLNAYLSKGEIEEKSVVLLLPLTYMNRSGESLQKALNRFSLPKEKIIVVHDDTDLELGTVRFSFSSGSAGHKGVASIIRIIKTKAFFRIRVGIRQQRNQEDALSFVLKKLPNSVEKIERETASAIKDSLISGLEKKTLTIDK
jgi:peptidyl-tRNA hydrolase, PTH1 family